MYEKHSSKGFLRDRMFTRMERRQKTIAKEVEIEMRKRTDQARLAMLSIQHSEHIIEDH